MAPLAKKKLENIALSMSLCSIILFLGHPGLCNETGLSTLGYKEEGSGMGCKTCFPATTFHYDAIYCTI